MVLDIIHIGHPLLRQVSKTLSVEELLQPETQTLIDDLIATMHQAGGVGIAAVQVARPIRICVIEVNQNPRYPYMPRLPQRVLVNPEIEILNDQRVFNYDGCLSVPGLRGAVERPLAIRVRALDRHAEPFVASYYGLAAVIVSHECDHLDGVLFLDRVSDPTSVCTWEMFETHHRQAEVEKWTTLQAQYPIAEELEV